MNTTHVTVAALLLATGLTAPLAHADMMEKDKGMMQDKKVMPDTKIMGGEMTGLLMGAKDHHASGTVTVMQDGKSPAVLRFDNLNVDKVPDGRVYLAKDGDYANGVELGKLSRFTGTVEFPIPFEVNPQDYNGVVVWCKRFSVEIGRASFAQSMMMDK